MPNSVGEIGEPGLRYVAGDCLRFSSHTRGPSLLMSVVLKLDRSIPTGIFNVQRV